MLLFTIFLFVPTILCSTPNQRLIKSNHALMKALEILTETEVGGCEGKVDTRECTADDCDHPDYKKFECKKTCCSESSDTTEKEDCVSPPDGKCELCDVEDDCQKKKYKILTYEPKGSLLNGECTYPKNYYFANLCPFGKNCVACTCRQWDDPTKTYSNCYDSEEKRNHGGLRYTVQCRDDGTTPMYGGWWDHANDCKAYALNRFPCTGTRLSDGFCCTSGVVGKDGSCCASGALSSDGNCFNSVPTEPAEEFWVEMEAAQSDPCSEGNLLSPANAEFCESVATARKAGFVTLPDLDDIKVSDLYPKNCYYKPNKGDKGIVYYNAWGDNFRFSIRKHGRSDDKNYIKMICVPSEDEDAF